MFDFTTLFTLTIFVLMVLFLLWRPHGVNESIPPTICAIFIFLAGIVPLSDIFKILGIVSGSNHQASQSPSLRSASRVA